MFTHTTNQTTATSSTTTSVSQTQAPINGNNTTIPILPIIASWPSADIRQFHSYNSSARAEFSDNQHAQTVQQKNLEKQQTLKKIDAVEKAIPQVEKIAQPTPESKQALQDLKTQHTVLKAELNVNIRKDVTSIVNGDDIEVVIQVDSDDDSNDDSTDESEYEDRESSPSVQSYQIQLIEINGRIAEIKAEQRSADGREREKKSTKLESQINKLKIEKVQLENAIAEQNQSSINVMIEDADDHGVDADFSNGATEISNLDVDPLKVMFDLIEDRNKLLAKLKRNFDADNKQENNENIKKLEDEIRILYNLYETLNAGETEVQPDGGTKSQNVSSLIRSKTIRHTSARANTSSSTTSQKSSNDQANFSSINSQCKRSSVRFPENLDLKKHFNETDIKKIHVLDQEMVNMGGHADDLLKSMQKLRKTIEAYRADEKNHPKTLKAFESRLKQLEVDFHKVALKLCEKLDDVVKLEEAMGLHPHKSAKEVEDIYNQLIKKHTSKKTKGLEEDYTEMLARLKKRIDENFWYRNGYDVVAGGLGFTVSFLIGNTVGRWIPPEYGVFVPAIIAGGLHVVVATPVVKQLMARTWSADSLNALNNNFKLMGAKWGDYWRGETDTKKYADKDKTKANKLTSQERMAQEESKFGLHGNRYKNEEAGYWLYTLDYTLKACAMAAAAAYFSTQTDESRVVETILHGAAGWLSGAGYIMLQQYSRSQRPGAEEKPVPTREIFAAEAAFLESLAKDLSDAMNEWKKTAKSEIDPTDHTERHLLKAIARTERARQIAKQKSGRAGILRYELGAQFAGDAKWDTLSEVFGRVISLFQVGTVNYLTADWRKSPDPRFMFLGHFVPAVALMCPTPVGGFTARPAISGLIRAGIQMFINGKAKQTIATQVPAPVVEKEPEEDSEESNKPAPGSAEDSSIVVDKSDSGSEETDDDGWHGNINEGERFAAN